MGLQMYDDWSESFDSFSITALILIHTSVSIVTQRHIRAVYQHFVIEMKLFL